MSPGGPGPTEPADAFRDAPALLALSDRAREGDASTLPALRSMLRLPEALGLLGGDLARQAEAALVGAAAGNDLAFKEALTRKLELLREGLLGPAPTALEGLLVGRVVACWLQVQGADVRTAQAKNPNLAVGDYLQRRMGRAHKRFLTACRTLALVRRLALPVLVAQVNIAARQVNKVPAH